VSTKSTVFNENLFHLYRELDGTFCLSASSFGKISELGEEDLAVLANLLMASVKRFEIQRIPPNSVISRLALGFESME
jgi:hypothetical protein